MTATYSPRRLAIVVALIPTIGLLGFVDMRNEQPDFVAADRTVPAPSTVAAIERAAAVGPATGAQRLTPPPPTVTLIDPLVITAPTVVLPVPVPVFDPLVYGTSCVGAVPLLAFYSPGWDPERMARLMWRESRCVPGVRNPASSATGLLQVLASHCSWLPDAMNQPCTRTALEDPEFNIRAAAALWLIQGYDAWAL